MALEMNWPTWTIYKRMNNEQDWDCEQSAALDVGIRPVGSPQPKKQSMDYLWHQYSGPLLSFVNICHPQAINAEWKHTFLWPQNYRAVTSPWMAAPNLQLSPCAIRFHFFFYLWTNGYFLWKQTIHSVFHSFILCCILYTKISNYNVCFFKTNIKKKNFSLRKQKTLLMMYASIKKGPGLYNYC